MGLNLSLYAADFARLLALPVERRVSALEDAVTPTHEAARDAADDRGWVWPPSMTRSTSGSAPWCAEYRFLTTTGKYRPHSEAGDGWDDMRVHVEPVLRTALDAVLDQLIWYRDPEDDPGATGGGVLPAARDPFRPQVLLVCPPSALARKAAGWSVARPRLAELREPFRVECEGWAGRPATFEAFTALVGEWADVVGQAAGRGWGLVGLPD
ncbi:hypothetical protein ABT160_46845 [Streptomyces sp. NPDC001941]|uniref:hypothetical protein n=1 Tax=Streptomyces sp. NPDC001941 TaxID=3154659 RepID=UPI003332CF9F